MNNTFLISLYNNPYYIKEIKKEDLTKEIVNMLEITYYEIIDELIKLNPNIVLFLKDIDEDKMLLALNNGLNIDYNDFMNSSNLREYAYLFNNYLEMYPNIIKYYKKEYINYINMSLAVKNGYIPSVQDILDNKDLRSFRDVMEPLIKDNPNMIKYINRDCPIHSKVLEDTFNIITLTKEDFENNPELTKSVMIYEYLPQDLKMYSIYFDEREKLNIVIDALNDKCDLEDLPFFNKKLGANLSIEKAQQIKNISLNNISKDLKTQEEYLSILHKLIDACANIRYKREKNRFIYKDIVALYRKIYLALESNDSKEIINLKNNICDFIYPGIDLNKMSKEQEKIFHYVNSYIDYFKKLYDCNSKITLADTSEFGNTILNRHRNRFLSNENKKISFEIKTKFELTEKKERLIINKYKIYNIREYIVNKQFNKLNIDENIFIDMMINVRNVILNNKKFIKSGIIIEEKLFESLEKHYLQVGELELSDVFDILHIEDKKIGKYILRKYNNIRLNYLSCIDDNLLSKEDFINEKEKIDINQLNFIIGNDKNYKKNLAKLLLSMSDDELQPYIDNKDLLIELNYLLVFSDIFKELTIETVKNIIHNQSKVRNVINDYNNFESFTRKIDDIIMLSNGYAVSSDINRFIISDEVLFKLPIQRINKYIDIYLKSLTNKESFIPSIKFKINNIKYSTAYRWEQQKLLIGRLDNEASCIDLASGGEETYKEVLLEKTGSVIIIRKNEQEAIGRIFLIRRGNIVQIVVNKNIKLDYEIYKNIAEQLIFSSINNNDNIDYVVINSEVLERQDLITISDSKFVNLFPHADLDDVVTLILSKNQVLGKEEDFNFDFEVEPKVSYSLERKRIILNPTDNEVNRILAIKASMMGLDESSFEPYYDKLYEKSAVGEDWFYGIKKNGEVVEVELPLNHLESKQEINYVKKELEQKKFETKKIL